MDTGEHGSRSVGALLAAIAGLAIWLSGCAAPAPVETDAPSNPIAIAAVERAPVQRVPTERAPPANRPESTTPAPAPATVAVLYSGSIPTQAAIAERIAVDLAAPAFAVRRIDIDGLDRATPIDAAFEAEVGIVAAVGPGALEVARQRFAGAEIVFSQVLEPGYTAGAARHIRGVAPVPRAALQFKAWAEVDPELRRIGLITGERYAAGVPDAAEAAAAIGAEIVHRMSSSDRETLYVFRRLAPAIDGLWLVPDSEILSTAVIDEMLVLAAELDIGVLVFSETLLERGGLISVVAPAEHVAASVVDAIATIRAGDAASLPAEIPLEEASVRVNARVAGALGLTVPAIEWVIRDGS